MDSTDLSNRNSYNSNKDDFDGREAEIFDEEELDLLFANNNSTATTSLADAIERKQIFFGIYYIINGSDINTQDGNGSTLLHELIDELSSGCYYELDEDEGNILQSNLNFPISVKENRISLIDALEYLVKNYHPALLQDISGNTPLHDAAKILYEDFDISEIRKLIYLLTEGQSKKSLNLLNEYHVSAWMLSVLHNTPQSSILAEITDIEINQVIRGRYGYEHSYGLSENLFKKIENLWGMLNSSQMIGVLSGGWSDLMLLCLFENYEALDIILERKDLKHVNSDYIFSDSQEVLREILPEENPLHYAIINEDIELFKFLLKKLGPDYLLAVNSQGHTPLHKATHVKFHKALSLLLNYEELKKICEPKWQLSEDLYRKFVNFDSSQGMAAGSYSRWLCTLKFKNEADYKLFVDCQYYMITVCDRWGDSLVHILAQEGYAQLLLYASSTRKDVRFDWRNGYGQTPLQVATESEASGTDEVIKALANFANQQYDINPNIITTYYINIRKRLQETVEETFNDTAIEGLTIDRLLDIYLTGEPFEGYGYLTHVDIKVAPIVIDGIKQEDLTRRIEFCLSYLETHYYGEHNILFVAPHLNASDKALFQILKSADEDSDNDLDENYEENSNNSSEDSYIKVFNCTINSVNVQVAILQRNEKTIRHKVRFSYDELVSIMGNEWDYQHRLPRYKNDKKMHSNKFIFSQPQIPLIYLLIKKIKNEFPKEIDPDSLLWKKYLAFLCFPYIENFSIFHNGKLNSLSSHIDGVIKEKFIEKLKQQASNLKFSTEIAVNAISYDNSKSLSDKEINFLKEGKKESGTDQQKNLYLFGLKFCERLRQVISSRRLRPRDRGLYLLTDLAELLEGDTTCLAVTFTDKFIISSNFTSKKARTDLRKVFEKMTEEIFSHFKKLACTQKCNPDNAISILAFIANEHLKSLNNSKFIIGLFEKNLNEFMSYCYFNFGKIAQYLITSEEGELHKKNFAYFLCKTFRGWLKLDINDEKIFVAVVAVADELCRLCKGFLNLEESILTNNPYRKMPKEMLDIIKNSKNISDSYEILANEREVHAETAVIEELFNKHKGKKCSVGTSKICCPCCTLLAEAVNFMACFEEGLYVYTGGTHNTHDQWKIPELFFTNPSVFSAFLGGKGSGLHQLFEQFESKDKIIAFHVIQDIYKLTREAEFKDLAEILKRETYSHIRAPYIIDELDHMVYAHVFEYRPALTTAFTNLEKTIQHYTANSIRVKSGYFKGSQPRPLRDIEYELAQIIKLKQGAGQGDALKRAINSLIIIAKRMGSQHPIFIAAKKYYCLLTSPIPTSYESNILLKEFFSNKNFEDSDSSDELLSKQKPKPNTEKEHGLSKQSEPPESKHDHKGHNPPNEQIKSKILKISGFGNNCGLFALALGVKKAFQQYPDLLATTQHLEFLTDISEQTLQSYSSYTPNVSKLLRETVQWALKEDRNFKDLRQENFIAALVEVLNKKPYPLDMEAFFKAESNLSFIQEIQQDWTKLHSSLQSQQEKLLEESLQVLNSIKVPIEAVDSFYKVLSELLKNLDTDISEANAQSFAKQLFAHCQKGSLANLPQLMEFKKLWTLAWERVTREQASEDSRQLLNEAVKKHLKKMLMDQFQLSNTSMDCSKLISIALLETVKLVSDSKISSHNIQQNILYANIRNIYASTYLYLKGKWDAIYKNYCNYIGVSNVMLSGDELAHLGRYWKIQVEIDFRDGNVRKSYKVLDVQKPLIKLFNKDIHWEIIINDVEISESSNYLKQRGEADKSKMASHPSKGFSDEDRWPFFKKPSSNSNQQNVHHKSSSIIFQKSRKPSLPSSIIVDEILVQDVQMQEIELTSAPTNVDYLQPQSPIISDKYEKEESLEDNEIFEDDMLLGKNQILETQKEFEDDFDDDDLDDTKGNSYSRIRERHYCRSLS